MGIFPIPEAGQRNQNRERPERQVGDRKFARSVAFPAQLIFQNLYLGEEPNLGGLDACQIACGIGLPEKIGEQRRAIGGAFPGQPLLSDGLPLEIGRNELSRLVRQIAQDRTRFPKDKSAVVDHRGDAVGVQAFAELGIGPPEIALAIHIHRLERDFRFAKRDGDFGSVTRAAVRIAFGQDVIEPHRHRTF